MTIGSLFAGIGGLELGLEAAGLGPTRWQVELDPYCRAVLARHWPDATRYDDVRTIQWPDVEPVDVICGGFPCQPHSVAGRRGGTADDRWLWCDFARAIETLRPRAVVVENVPGLLTSDGDSVCDSLLGGRMGNRTRRPVRGGAFGAVLADLAALGYDAEWFVFGADDLGAPHKRARLWIVAAIWGGGRSRQPQRELVGRGGCSPVAAYDGPQDATDTEGERRGSRVRQRRATPERHGGRHAQSYGSVVGEAATDPDCPRLALGQGEPGDDGSQRAAAERASRLALRAARERWLDGPAVAPLRRVDDGATAGMDRRRLHALGNAVVPQCAEHVGRHVQRLLTAHGARRDQT